MIHGEVNADHEPVISVLIRGAEGLVLEVAAVVDTGFSDFLTLPPDLVAMLQLPLLDSVEFTLANGIRERMQTFRARIEWDGREQEIIVTGTESDPLIGMALLRGQRLIVDVVDGGTVTIEPVPSTPGA